MNFAKFLKDNGLRKSEVAEYLGVVPSNVTAYIKTGNVPAKNLEILRSNAKGWDLSALDEDAPENENEVARGEVELLRSELELLRQIVNNQSAVIARYEAIIGRVYDD